MGIVWKTGKDEEIEKIFMNHKIERKDYLIII